MQKRSQNRMGMGARWKRAVTRLAGPLAVGRRTRASPGGDSAGSGPTSRHSSCRSLKQPLLEIATLTWPPGKRSQPGRVSQNLESGYVCCLFCSEAGMALGKRLWSGWTAELSIKWTDCRFYSSTQWRKYRTSRKSRISKTKLPFTQLKKGRLLAKYRGKSQVQKMILCSVNYFTYQEPSKI